MKYIDEYRDGALAESLVNQIRATCTKPWIIMEVCGGQTHGLLRYGIDGALEGKVELLHGPGCPVCVTSVQAIDFAIELSKRSDTMMVTFGDMLRVPGSRGSLLDARCDGANVHMVYSPLDAVEFARKHPDRNVVFFAVGFETTAPATALAVLQADRYQLSNFYLLSAHVRVVPAMEQIAGDSDCCVDGFLAAGHVCTVCGLNEYVPFVEKYQMPVVATGFEPVDLLQGILECVRLLEKGEAKVINAYPRSVRFEGNLKALQLIHRVFEVVDQEWRGLGRIPAGGFGLRPEWTRMDAWQLKDDALPEAEAPTRCLSGEILTGRMKPDLCPFFGSECTPEKPMGAPMVSSEGACAAYFAYQAGSRSASPSSEHAV